jgi:hypothetical protein
MSKPRKISFKQARMLAELASLYTTTKVYFNENTLLTGERRASASRKINECYLSLRAGIMGDEMPAPEDEDRYQDYDAGVFWLDGLDNAGVVVDE